MKELRVLFTFTAGLILLVALVLALTAGPSAQAADPQGSEFIPQEARIHVSRGPHDSEVELVVGLVILGAGAGGLALVLGLTCLAIRAPRPARSLGWLAIGAGLVPTAVFLMDAGVLPTAWSGAGIGIVVVGAVAVVGGVGVVLLADRRLGVERKAAFEAARAGRAERGTTVHPAGNGRP